MSQWHLFGNANITSTFANLPKFTSEFRLIGIFASNKLTNNSAIIADANGVQKLYKKSDVIDKGIKIYKILPKAVILEHNGQLEVLAFPNKALNFGSKAFGSKVIRLSFDD